MKNENIKFIFRTAVLLIVLCIVSSGQPAARKGDYHVCTVMLPWPHIGGKISTGCPSVLIGGKQAARVGDEVECVLTSDYISSGSFTVFIGGKPAARKYDLTSHGGFINEGYESVLIGGGIEDFPSISSINLSNFSK